MSGSSSLCANLPNRPARSVVTSTAFWATRPSRAPWPAVPRHLSPDPAILPEILDTFTNETDLVLTPLALVLTSQLVDWTRQRAEADPAAYLPALASSLNNVSVRLGEWGRREEGLAAIEEAVAIRRARTWPQSS
jgi:hypothetical protein